jgi:hypothetical protein
MWGVVFLVGLAVVLIGYEIVKNYQDFHQRADKMRKDFIAQQKAMVKQEVYQVVDLINYKIEQTGKNEDNIERKLLKSISKIRSSSSTTKSTNDIPSGFVLSCRSSFSTEIAEKININSPSCSSNFMFLTS